MDAMAGGIALFQQGGVVMYALLACSLFVVYIAAERALYYKRTDAGAPFAVKFYAYMKAHNDTAARELSASAQGALPQLLSDMFAGAGGARSEAYMEMQCGIILANLKSRLYYLNVIVTMAPLLGLLGTISGMIRSFRIFNAESGQAIAITGGVGEALIATAFGLCVAILALVVHAYFTQRINRIITDMEVCCSSVALRADEKDGDGHAPAR